MGARYRHGALVEEPRALVHGGDFLERDAPGSLDCLESAGEDLFLFNYKHYTHLLMDGRVIA